VKLTAFGTTTTIKLNVTGKLSAARSRVRDELSSPALCAPISYSGILRVNPPQG